MKSAPSDPWLAQVYEASSNDDLIRLYDGWAETYDADMQGIGYLHPAVIAGLLGRYVPNPLAAILDAGVGTGMLGGILGLVGYRNLLGIDISDGMLARAAKLGVYRDLRNRVLGEKLDFETASIDVVISTGVFTSGHGPASAWDELVRIVRPGGFLISTFGTIVWEEQGFRQKFESLIASSSIAEAEITPVYRPMPFSPTESEFTTRAHVYRRL
jgi:predicted TPR repeat methyltransferase